MRQPLCLWIEEWRYVFARITQLMDDAILNFRLGKYSPNRRRESRQIIRAGDENVLHASVFQPVEYRCPVLGTFVFSCPHPQHVFFKGTTHISLLTLFFIFLLRSFGATAPSNRL